MVRVVGTDPGTSSLDLVLLVDGSVHDQARLTPDDLRADPGIVVATLNRWVPLNLVAGPSGYGVPLVRGVDLTEADLDQMSLVRPEERGSSVGILGFRSWVRTVAALELPVLFLPGGIHLPTIPRHRKWNTIDLGTPDKVAVAALALYFDAEERPRDAPGRYSDSTFAVVEIGSAFTAVLVVANGKLVDAAAGTRGPIGMRSGGAWDGEVAYWRSPLSKTDLFQGGLDDLGVDGPDAFRESLIKHVGGLRTLTPFDRIYLSGIAASRGEIDKIARQALSGQGTVRALPNLPGAWVKHAAQGAAILADGLAGGSHADLVTALELQGATGSLWDYLCPPPHL